MKDLRALLREGLKNSIKEQSGAIDWVNIKIYKDGSLDAPDVDISYDEDEYAFIARRESDGEMISMISVEDLERINRTFAGLNKCPRCKGHGEYYTSGDPEVEATPCDCADKPYKTGEEGDGPMEPDPDHERDFMRDQR